MFKETGALLLLFGFACIPTFGQPVALFVLIVLAFGRPAMTFKCLVAGGTVALITLQYHTSGEGGSVALNGLKWLLLLAALARIMVAHGHPTKIYGTLLKNWGPLAGTLVLNALFVSKLPGISAFKALSFSLGLLCVIRLAMLTRDQNTEMLLFISEMGTAVVILSIPLLPLPLGWRVGGGNNFNGITLHPQALGIFLAMTGAATLITSFKVPGLRRQLIVCGLAQWAMIYPTHCRTALVAIVLGLSVYLIEVLARGGRDSRLRFVSVPLIIMTATLSLLIFVVVPDIRQGLAEFIRKGDIQSLSTLEDYQSALQAGSRGKQIFNVLAIVDQDPWFGFGFGVDPDSEKSMNANGAQLFGIPLSAPVEQGFLPIATVAQIGIIGSLFVFPIVISLYYFARQDSPELAGLFVVVLGVNFGEMIFFSFGGQGLTMWMLLVFIAVGGAIPRQYSGVRVG
ncbi:MAG: O-antigen ligase family protein [Terracidiphilus sp.]|jgi:hypothetical protein